MFEFLKKKELNIWKVFSDETNAKFISAKYDQSAKTEIIYDNWKIIFDNYINYIVVGNSSSEKTYTRVVVPYESIDNFRFEIYNNGLIRNIEKLPLVAYGKIIYCKGRTRKLMGDKWNKVKDKTKSAIRP